MFGHQYLGVGTGHSVLICSFRQAAGSTTRLASFICSAISVLKLQVREFGARRDLASRCRTRKIFYVRTDQPLHTVLRFSTFRDKIKRLNVVCRIEIFFPKMAVGLKIPSSTLLNMA